MENVVEMCELTQAGVKRFKLKGKEAKEIAKKDAELQATLYSAVKEMKEKVERKGDRHV